jgi:peptide/nickel transport system substrate-binding protein
MNGTAAAARARLAGLAIETLVRLDGHGRFHPGLAESWQKDSQGRRWEFRIRSGVRTHDGGTLGAATVAAALERLDAGWIVRAEAGVVRVEPVNPDPDLLWELADPSAGIAIVTGSQVVGTGPFRIERWEPGRQAVLRAHEDYWGGRPFLDAVQVDMGRRLPDQLADLELGRADIVSVQPQDVRRIEQRGLRTVSTAPVEIVALVVGDARSGPADDGARKALAQSIDRGALAVLLQRHAEPAGGLLPQWLSGYAFLLRPDTDRLAARTSAQALAPPARAWRVQVDPHDAVLQALAGRLVLDAREAGLSVSLAALGLPGPLADARLIRRFVPVASPERALRLLWPELGISPHGGVGDERRVGVGTLDAAWRLESSVVDRHLVIPLVHLPELFGVGPRVAGWLGPAMEPPGGLQLERAWLRGEHP